MYFSTLYWDWSMLSVGCVLAVGDSVLYRQATVFTSTGTGTGRTVDSVERGVRCQSGTDTCPYLSRRRVLVYTVCRYLDIYTVCRYLQCDGR